VAFKKRGDASLGTILTGEFVRGQGESPYSARITQDTDLPRKLQVNFADGNHEQQTNTVISQRPLDTVDSVRELTIDLTTYLLTPAEAQPLADRYFRRQWNSREAISMRLTAQRFALEPADVYTLSLDGVTRNARLTRLSFSGGAIETEWVRDYGGLAAVGTGTGAEIEGPDPEVILVPGASKGFVLDLPLLTDAESNVSPLLHYAGGSYGVGTVNGVIIFESDGTSTYTNWATVGSTELSTWGYATDVLGDANPSLWDKGNSVNINVRDGTLSSVTAAEIDADPTLNLAYLGGELINFTTAVLEGDGTYTLSGFKRGRRGTERFTGTHIRGDTFILAARMSAKIMGASDIGLTQTYESVTLGRSPQGVGGIDVTFAGNSLKPYAPARVKAHFDGADWTFDVVRRTRVGGAWVGGSTIPLSENSEAYEIEVYSGATLKRTLSLSGTNSVVYTNAMQVTDFGSTQTTKPTLKVYQMSDVVGRGFELAA
jgi:hypothetical protein